MTSHELLRLAQALNERDEPYAVVTVVRVAPPTSAFVGAQAIVEHDGTLTGWVGGGCARDVVVEAARAAIASGEPRLLRIANDAQAAEQGVEQHAMACASNGTIELFVQPHSTRHSLCVLGETPAAVDARFFAARLGIRLVATPDDARVVLIATQGAGDADALERALASTAPHVLMIASRRKARTLAALMRIRGVDDARLARLRAPAGPDAGATTPAEIALVAMTGVLACLRGRDGAAESGARVTSDAAGDGGGTAEGGVAPMGAPPARGSARLAEREGIFINPVCGVAVSTATPMHVETYEGEAYYFCCNGCWITFRQDPARFAAIRRASMEKVAS
jgi:xanthine dehydrogenase accessory factor